MCEVCFDETYEQIAEDYRNHLEKYYSYMTGIDKKEFEYLNGTLETPVDETAFLEGKCCILYRDNLDFDMKKLSGKKVSGYLYDRPETAWSIAIAGLSDDVNAANMLGSTPTVIVSDKFFKQIVKEPGISKVSIRYKKEYDEAVEKDIKDAMKTSPYAKDFSYDSKLDDMKDIKKMQGRNLICRNIFGNYSNSRVWHYLYALSVCELYGDCISDPNAAMFIYDIVYLHSMRGDSSDCVSFINRKKDGGGKNSKSGMIVWENCSSCI